ncbi:unnamed protein product [Bursaphelenchus xylophilus]|uniref:(pine wood nematode) hypothetical protein n=1 Tax=Bursaphelenchus xylophilus TaxID=6326 RepID=A0A7I8XB02_BURXY|nr:unnamed protein product [Bursaphelenchus xylophilus]CAG9082846.1 unnamed protein product [Bursaphelenchus xylophilus]
MLLEDGCHHPIPDPQPAFKVIILRIDWKPKPMKSSKRRIVKDIAQGNQRDNPFFQRAHGSIGGIPLEKPLSAWIKHDVLYLPNIL